MRRLLILTIILSFLIIAHKASATATSEISSPRAKPVTLYAKTSGGTVTAVRVTSDGKLQVATE